MVSLAFIFAGTTKSFGQDLNYLPATACAPITALTCAADGHLNPLPGKTYTYSIDVNPDPATVGYIQWFVYDATVTGGIMVGGSIAAAVAAAEANDGTSQYLISATAAAYNSNTNISPNIDISWQSFDGATKRILLVAYVKGENGCNDNMEVWRIEPSFAFTLDIAGLMPDGNLPATGNAVECIVPVQDATYDGTNLTMNYGENYIFYTVTAANFVHSWQPTFSMVANNTQTAINIATDVTWAYPDQAILVAGTWNAVTDPVLAVAGSGSVGAAGECIIVRVRLDHNGAENDATAARNVILGVDGTMYNVVADNYTTASLRDIDPSASAPCTNTVTDQAQYDLTPRPQIVEITPAPGTFEPKN